jgi:hypothetical protein
MGAGQGKVAPPPWRPPQGGYYAPHVEQAVRALTESPQTFLTPVADLQAVGGEAFDPAQHLAFLETAIKNDERISQWLPRLVPKRVSEQDFWKNYYSHVIVLTRNQPVFATVEEAAAAEVKPTTGDQPETDANDELKQITQADSPPVFDPALGGARVSSPSLSPERESKLPEALSSVSLGAFDQPDRQIIFKTPEQILASFEEERTQLAKIDEK